MAATFSRTMRSLNADGFRGLAWTLLLTTVLLIAWLAWFFLARVAVYEVSDLARLEVQRSAHPIEAPVAGQIVTASLSVGRSVQRGEVLVTLDTSSLGLQLAEEQARSEALSGQREALGGEIEALERAMGDADEAAQAARAEARARHTEAEAAARFAEEQVEHVNTLRAIGNASEIEQRRALAEAEQLAAATEAARLAVIRLERDQCTIATERTAQLKGLAREGTRLDGEIATIAAVIDRLKHEMELRQIRAPIAGQLGEITTLQAGSFVMAGDRLGAIVPPGEVKLVAQFAPPQALGRIRVGQSARLRLTGFPWSQYGSVPATTARVGSELRQGRIQVEFEVDFDGDSPIPMQHGLPGTVEVEVERISPAAMLLRAIGMRLTPRQTRPSTDQGEGRAAP